MTQALDQRTSSVKPWQPTAELRERQIAREREIDEGQPLSRDRRIKPWLLTSAGAGPELLTNHQRWLDWQDLERFGGVLDGVLDGEWVTFPNNPALPRIHFREVWVPRLAEARREVPIPEPDTPRADRHLRRIATGQDHLS